MKALSNIAMVLATAGLGFACGALALAWAAPAPPPFVAPERAAAQAAPVPEREAAPIGWPAVFGEVVIPEPEPEPDPEPEPEPEPEPVVEDLPPEESTIYYLTGLVIDGRDSWAMVSSNDLTRVVRVGDVLEDGEVVTAIDPTGVSLLWGDIRQLIPVQRSDLSALAQRDDPDPVLPPATLGDVNWSVERLDPGFIEEALAEAGRLAGSIQADGSRGLDVVWIRQGQLYDTIGLKTGDTILRINGKTVDGQDMPATAPKEIYDARALNLEILRDGARQVIHVKIDQI